MSADQYFSETITVLVGAGEKVSYEVCVDKETGLDVDVNSGDLRTREDTETLVQEIYSVGRSALGEDFERYNKWIEKCKKEKRKDPEKELFKKAGGGGGGGEGYSTKTALMQTIEDRKKEDERRRQEALVLKNKGNEALTAKNYRVAYHYYTQGLCCDHKNAILWSNRSEALLRLGRMEEGWDDAERAIQLDPKHEKSYFRKCSALVGLGKRKEALQVIQSWSWDDDEEGNQKEGKEKPAGAKRISSDIEAWKTKKREILRLSNVCFGCDEVRRRQDRKRKQKEEADMQGRRLKGGGNKENMYGVRIDRDSRFLESFEANNSASPSSSSSSLSQGQRGGAYCRWDTTMKKDSWIESFPIFFSWRCHLVQLSNSAVEDAKVEKNDFTTKTHKEELQQRQWMSIIQSCITAYVRKRNLEEKEEDKKQRKEKEKEGAAGVTSLSQTLLQFLQQHLEVKCGFDINEHTAQYIKRIDEILLKEGETKKSDKEDGGIKQPAPPSATKQQLKEECLYVLYFLLQGGLVLDDNNVTLGQQEEGKESFLNCGLCLQAVLFVPLRKACSSLWEDGGILQLPLDGFLDLLHGGGRGANLITKSMTAQELKRCVFFRLESTSQSPKDGVNQTVDDASCPSEAAFVATLYVFQKDGGSIQWRAGEKLCLLSSTEIREPLDEVQFWGA